METSVRTLVERYSAAVGRGDFSRLGELVHPQATFAGTVVAEAEGRDAFVQGFRNLAPITVRTEIREIVVTEDRAALLYDLVTDTAVGVVLCAEFLEFEGGLIRSSTLVFDWRRWPEVLAELRDRSSDIPGGAPRPSEGP